jgi:hypothetical protein
MSLFRREPKERIEIRVWAEAGESRSQVFWSEGEEGVEAVRRKLNKLFPNATADPDPLRRRLAGPFNQDMASEIPITRVEALAGGKPILTLFTQTHPIGAAREIAGVFRSFRHYGNREDMESLEAVGFRRKGEPGS